MLRRAEYRAREHDVAQSRALIDEALATDEASPDDVNRSRYFADVDVGNWNAAVLDARAYGAAISLPNARLRTQAVRVFVEPLLAYALARTGDFRSAHAEIDKTPADCVSCETAHGNIDALEGNTAGAAWWFAGAIRDAPSIPFAWSDWGAMLLRRGDPAGAIAKLEPAHGKGPHFADPLELWGEALMLQNRSDLAIAKFEEAAREAPNWGRLYLKWGEALTYAGRKDEARKALQQAAGLDMSATDKAELQRMRARHG